MTQEEAKHGPGSWEAVRAAKARVKELAQANHDQNIASIGIIGYSDGHQACVKVGLQTKGRPDWLPAEIDGVKIEVYTVGEIEAL